MRHRVAVIGAGTAGCVVAGRLAEHDDLEVVLIEEGHPANRWRSARELWSLDGTLDPTTSQQWHVRQSDTEDRRSGAQTLLTGRGPGGSGRINGGYFIRPTTRDLDRWSRQIDDEGWGERLVAAMIRSETDLMHPDDPAHGHDGPVMVERDTAPLHPLSEAFHRSASAFGLADHPDMNDAGTTGVGPVPFNASAGRLVDPAAAYLVPALDRGNLTLVTGRHVRRLVSRDRRIVAVESTRDDGDRVVDVLEVDDVILCAGTFGSARILLASGIGDPDQLHGVGTAVVADSPGVGHVFWNHPCVDLFFEPDPTVLSAAAPTDPFMQLVAHTTSDGVGAVNAEFMATRRPYGQVTGEDPSDRSLSMRVTLIDAATTGWIRPVASTMATDRLEVHIGYDSTARDRTEMRKAVEVALEMMSHRGFSELFHGGVRSPIPAPATSFHMIGSCPMGIDPVTSVVDPSFRVHGVEGLRIVDGSVIPLQISRGPSACIVGLGELAAANFISDRGLSRIGV